MATQRWGVTAQSEQAAQAAQKEREQRWEEAAALWESVARMSTLAPNQDWATCRADFCRKRASYGQRPFTLP